MQTPICNGIMVLDIVLEPAKGKTVTQNTEVGTPHSINLTVPMEIPPTKPIL